MGLARNSMFHQGKPPPGDGSLLGRHGGTFGSPGLVETHALMRRICSFVWRAWKALVPPVGIRWRRLCLFARGVRYGNGLLIEPYAVIDGTGQVEIGDRVWLGRGVYIHVWPQAKLIIEHDTYIGRGTIVLVHQNVRIGNHGMVAPYCHITDVNHSTRPGSPMRTQPLESRPVDIGADVWLGAGCSVLPGVRIGQGCAIGARAVVTKSLPEYAVAVGIPAKPIRFRQLESAAE